jgi:hypothetical protein
VGNIAGLLAAGGDFDGYEETVISACNPAVILNKDIERGNGEVRQCDWK